MPGNSLLLYIHPESLTKKHGARALGAGVSKGADALSAYCECFDAPASRDRTDDHTPTCWLQHQSGPTST